jgi:hypothetical protein
MSNVVQVAYPSAEPVSVAEFTNYARIFVTSDNTLIGDLITGAREWVEDQTGLSLASRNFIQFEDSLPFVPYGFSGFAYAGTPSLYFGGGPLTPYPPFGWNQRVNPFEIQIKRNPVTNVDHIEYVDVAGYVLTLEPETNFLVDYSGTVCRLSPLPGQPWPQCTPGLGNVRIYFTAGGTQATPGGIGTGTITETDVDTPPTPPDQDTNSFTMTTDIPRPLKIAIFQLALHWYENRAAVTSGSATSIPHSVDAIIKSYRLLNMLPIVRA